VRLALHYSPDAARGSWNRERQHGEHLAQAHTSQGTVSQVCPNQLDMAVALPASVLKNEDGGCHSSCGSHHLSASWLVSEALDDMWTSLCAQRCVNVSRTIH